MAAGDIKWFAQGLLDLGNEIHDLDGDSLYLGIVTAATVPALSTAAPHWNGTGTTNFYTNQVGTGGGYTGPILLTSVTWSLVSNVPTLRAATVTITANASGFTDGRYGIIFNETAANNQCLGFVDLGATISIAAANFVFDWNGATNDLLTLTQS